MATRVLTTFERDVIGMLVAGDHAVLRALQAQLAHAAVARRDSTGVGLFTELVVPRALAVGAALPERWMIADVEASIDGLRRRAGFVLFVDNGLLTLLEGYCYDEVWPAKITGYSLRYTRAGACPLRHPGAP